MPHNSLGLISMSMHRTRVFIYRALAPSAHSTNSLIGNAEFFNTVKFDKVDQRQGATTDVRGLFLLDSTCADVSSLHSPFPLCNYWL